MSSAVDLEDRPGPTPAPTGGSRRPGDLARTVARGIGQTLITFGLVALLFVAYTLWVTDLLSAREQDQLTQEIQQQWADAPTVTPPQSAPPGSAPSAGAPSASAPPAGAAGEPAPAAIEVGVGEPFAVLHIPRLGADWQRVVVEGTSQVELAQGPGHYLGTAMPGEQGNLALAGHRVGHGAPFLDLDLLQPGDPVVVETATHWFVYRVLGDPATGGFEGDPSGIPGRQIVRPTDVDVIAPVPGGPEVGPADGAYLTLTTCHPKYSAQQRLVVHARLEGGPTSKTTAPDGPPALAG